MILKALFISFAAWILVIWLFFFAIPVNFAIRHTILIAILGCISICIASVAFFAALVKFLRRNNPDVKPKDYEGYLIFGIILVSLFGSGILLITNGTNLESREFSKYGQFTTGIVTSGKIMKIKKTDFSSLTVRYNADGREYTESVDMPASIMDNYGIGQEIPLVYSKRYPKIVRIVSNSDISLYTRKAEKKLSVDDLLKVMEMKTSDEALKYLNELNQKWTAKQGAESRSVVYENRLRNMVIKVIGEEELTFASEDSVITDEDVLQAGFKAIPNEITGGITYENNNFLLNINRKRVGDISQGISYMPVISIVKK